MKGLNIILIRPINRLFKMIKFQLENPIHPEIPEQKEGGNGLAGIQKRLKLVYPERHHLDIIRSDNFQVSLRLAYDYVNHRRR